jgi:prefoldin subunit 5
MSTITTESLYNSIESLKRSMGELSRRVTELEDIAGIYVTQSTMQTAMADMQTTVDNMSESLMSIENKLQKISLPQGTRFYLEESEITDFRNHFRQLRSMMSELEKSRQAFIRLASRYNLTNSTL